jgi:hypothetical protein
LKVFFYRRRFIGARGVSFPNAESYKEKLKQRLDHGLIKHIDTKSKCRNLNKLTCKVSLRQVFIRVYIDWKYHSISHVGIFGPSFVNCNPSNLLSGSSFKVQYIQTVCG